MRYAFIADIHGNAQALAAVLGEIDSLGIASIFCLGDIVGYGAEPSRCIATIRDRNIPTIVGNHDLAAARALSIENFNDNAKASAEWTYNHLTNLEKDFLKALPLEFKNHDFQLAHGAPMDPAAFDYILTPADAVLTFGAMERALLFTAHSHVPLGLVWNGKEISASPMGSVVIPPNARAIVNVGSVGQPRDRDNRASYVIVEPGQVRFVRVPYPVDVVVQKVHAVAELDDYLGLRLMEGR